jgi:hypothetical protein
MAITSYAAALAAERRTYIFGKTSGTPTINAGPIRCYGNWNNSGLIGAASVSVAGINGQAVALGGTGIVTIPRVNPPGGTTAYLAALEVGQVPGPGTLLLIDRLWQNNGISPTVLTAQTLTPVAMSARDLDGSSNGRGVLAALEWGTAAGTGTVNATISYTNSTGTAGRTAVLSSLSSIIQGGFEFFPLQAGDEGVRSIESFTWSATHTSGTPVLVLFKPLAQIEVSAAQGPCSIDEITGGFPIIPDGTVYQLLWFPAITGASFAMAGKIVEAWG